MVLSRVKNIFSRIGLSILIGSVFLSSCKSSSNLVSGDEQIKANNFLTLPNAFQQIQQNRNTEPFQWGVSTAGYQCEGYDTTSIWNKWDLSGKTENRNPKGVDFLNRYQEDIQLAKNMGINSFRFSIEWSRIEPRNGVIDPNGIQFYRNVIKALKDRNMTPLVTLVHFNYPQWLIDESSGFKKGLENPDFVRYYLRYVETVVKEFGPDVKYWLTFNEPNIWIPGSYLLGLTPPGKKNPLATARAAWNLLKAHSKAYDLIHQLDPDSMVSSNVFYVMVKPFGPVTPVPGTESTTKGQTLDDKNMMDTDWFYESLSTGRTTIDSKALNEGNVTSQATQKPKTLAEELNETDLRGNPLPADRITSKGDSLVGWLKKFDYVSFDYYYRFHTINQMLNLTKFWDMEMYPQGLHDAIIYYQRKYNKPIMIAENGMATENLKPRTDRWTREAGLVEHVKAVKSAMAEGANVLGYYYWSITDNYEWGTFTPRFGLYSINALTDPEMKRIPTPAVDAYKAIIQNNGVTDQILSKYVRR